MINTQKQTQTHGKPYFGKSYYKYEEKQLMIT